MDIRDLKHFLDNKQIKLYDQQYRILTFLINKHNINNQYGGGKKLLSHLLGNNKNEITKNINNYFI